MNTVDKEDFVTVDPEIMHGTSVFKGTRVPIDTLFDYLATSDSLEEFLEDFPSVYSCPTFSCWQNRNRKM